MDSTADQHMRDDQTQFGHLLFIRQHPGQPLQANSQEADRLIQGAREKMALYEECIGIEELRIAEFSRWAKPFESLLSYVARSVDRREKVTNIFWRDGEYGLPLSIATEDLSELEAQAKSLSDKISSTTKLISDLKLRIDFLKEDISLLESIKHLDSAHRVTDEALPICM